VPGPQLVQTAPWTGRTIPLQGTALGAALRGTVGAEGFSARHASVEPDITAVAAPVAGPDGTIVAALSVLAPTYRTGEDDVRAIGEALVAHARSLSAQLGGRPAEAMA
jgi:urocanate hydratase